MKAFNASLYGLAVVGFLAGCDPNAPRPEYTGNGQGGVDIRPVPYDRPAPQPDVPLVTIQAHANALETQIRQQQLLIDSLEALVQRQDAEIRQLKGLQPTTSPTTH
jgi:hypothetical protein